MRRAHSISLLHGLVKIAIPYRKILNGIQQSAMQAFGINITGAKTKQLKITLKKISYDRQDCTHQWWRITARFCEADVNGTAANPSSQAVQVH